MNHLSLFFIGSLLRLCEGFLVLRHAFSHDFDFVLTLAPVPVVSHAFLHVVKCLYAPLEDEERRGKENSILGFFYGASTRPKSTQQPQRVGL